MRVASLVPWLVMSTVFLAALSGLLRFRRLPPSLRWLALLACFDALMELTVLILSKVLHVKSNLFFIPFVAIGEVGLLFLAYREALRSAAFARALPWVVGLFSAYALLDSLAGLGVVHYATGVQLTADLLQLGLAALYFWQLLHELRVERLRADPFFWVSVGLVVFVLGDMLITLFSNYLLSHYSHRLQVILILAVRPWFIITLYCCYSLALWMRPPKPNSFNS
ncbi:MAG: hypothetical protein ACRYFZ_23220 [Janthinobacterium lividum]